MSDEHYALPKKGRLLVTGHRGLLGRAVIRQCADDYQIFTTNCDLRDAKFTKYIFEEHKPDFVIHCAARVGGVKANRDEPVEFLTQNLEIQNSVFAAAHAVGVKKLVNVATSCLFPREASVPVKEDSLLTGPFEPDVAAYAAAKLAGYFLCRAYRQQYGANWVTVAPSNLYGWNDNYGPSAHVVPALIARLDAANANKIPLRVWGDGSAIREFMYVDDAADAIKLVLEKYDSAELINIGTGVGTSIKELVDALVELTRFEHGVEWDTSQPTGIPRKTFDISKLKRLGFIARTSLRTGLRYTVEDYYNFPGDHRSK